MIRKTLLLALMTACSPAPAARAPGTGEAGEPLAAADIAAIRGTDSTFAGAFGAGDPAGVAATYLPDAHLLPPNADPVEGREAILKFWKAVLDAYQVTFSASADEIEGRGDLAYARGHFTMELTPKTGGGPAVHDEGKFLEILRREADGTWRYAVDMYSSNLPVPPAK